MPCAEAQVCVCVCVCVCVYIYQNLMSQTIFAFPLSPPRLSRTLSRAPHSHRRSGAAGLRLRQEIYR